jgi:hypothetical protein
VRSKGTELPPVLFPLIVWVFIEAKLALLMAAEPLKLEFKRPLIVFEPAAMTLFVSVSVVFLPTKVSVEIGKVRVPVLTIVAITGEVSVLLVSVSVVFLPTRVSVEVGRVSVPVLIIVEIIGEVSVLFVSVVAFELVTRDSTVVVYISMKLLVEL